MSTKVTAKRKAFDYAPLESEKRIIVKQKTTEIRDRVGQMGRNIFEIGERLVDVRDLLGEGEFKQWVEDEFEWSRSTAYNFISVATNLKGVQTLDTIRNFAESTLYLLAAPSTPAEVRKEFIEVAKERPVTLAEVKEALKPKADPEPAPAAVKPPTAKKGDACSDCGADISGIRLKYAGKCKECHGKGSNGTKRTTPEPTAASGNGKHEPEPEEPESPKLPWSDLTTDVAEIISLLRSVHSKMVKTFEFDDKTRKAKRKWCNHFSEHWTTQAINRLISGLKEAMPGELSNKDPGFITVGGVKAHRDAVKARLAS